MFIIILRRGFLLFKFAAAKSATRRASGVGIYDFLESAFHQASEVNAVAASRARRERIVRYWVTIVRLQGKRVPR